jgi:bla regulator protein BlaR1
MNLLSQLAAIWFDRLVWTSIQAVVLIAVIAMILRLLPRLPAAVRCMLWWLVSVQLLLGLCWHVPLELPLLAPVTAQAAVNEDTGTSVHVRHLVTAITASHRSSETPTPSSVMPAVNWRALLPALWLAAMLAQIPLLLRQWQRARRLLSAAEPLTDDAMLALCAQRARAIGLRHCPALYVSPDIDSPQVSGLRHPVVVLPAVHAMSEAESAMAMTHELAHLQRGDLWLGWLPALARRLFFFHPLVTWAMREYAFEREAACDAQVVQQTGTQPHAYASLLLRLGVAHPMHAGLAGASPTFRNLKRRLTMLQHIDPVSRYRMRGWLLVAVVALAGVVPYRVTAASSKLAEAAPVITSATSPMPLTPPPPPPMVPPAPPPPPPPPPDIGFSAQHVDIDTTNDSPNGFALFDGESTITINGSNADVDIVKKLHATNKSMLWFRRGNEAYLIHDKSMLERASHIYEPVTELARKQGELAGQQGGLAGQQAGLAARDAAFAGEQAELAVRQKALALHATAMTHASSSSQTADLHQRELDRQQAEMDAEQARLKQRHASIKAELVGQRHALDASQAVLDKQQHALEQQQQKTTQTAEQAMSHLLDEAIAKGLAEKTRLG